MCGVCGVVAVGRHRTTSFPARYAGNMALRLQHRGHEAAGAAVSDGTRIEVVKGPGTVRDVLEEAIDELVGNMAVAHVRYGTTGGSNPANAHPQCRPKDDPQVAVVHNGDLVNSRQLRAELEAQGAEFDSTGDTEAIAELLYRTREPSLEKAVYDIALNRMRGAWSMLVLGKEVLVAARDPHGIRPLFLGRMVNGDGEFYVVASETCAINNLPGGRPIREITPGEVLTITADGKLFSCLLPVRVQRRFCIFELVYFARPDSLFPIQQPNGSTAWVSAYQIRRAMGRNLGLECLEFRDRFDIISPVLDSGLPHAAGFCETTGSIRRECLVRDRSAGRTFIEPEGGRELSVELKHSVIRDLVVNLSVGVVDDSLVRATTMNHLISTLKHNRARAVHPLICSPPIIGECLYGIDTKPDQLIAARLPVEQIAREIGADSLTYLTLEGMVSATGQPAEEFCLACFNLDYPVPKEQAA